MPKLSRRCITYPKREVIKDHITSVVLVGARVAYCSEVEVLKISALFTHLISIMVNLVRLFILYFIL